MENDSKAIENSYSNFKVERRDWYVLTTKPKFEKKVNQGLNKAHIINYLPLHKKLRVWNDRKKWVEMPHIYSRIR